MTDQELHAACVAEIRAMRAAENAKSAYERALAKKTLRAKDQRNREQRTRDFDRRLANAHARRIVVHTQPLPRESPQ